MTTFSCETKTKKQKTKQNKQTKKKQQQQKTKNLSGTHRHFQKPVFKPTTAFLTNKITFAREQFPILRDQMNIKILSPLTLVLLRGVATTPLTVFALVLKIAQLRGKIALGTFKFILSLHFSGKISNLPPTPGVG